jgi:hypothetical protein
MAKIRVYRYDAEDYALDQVISSRGDHYETLTEKQKPAETLVRQFLPNGERVRSKSLYVWKDKDAAKRIWRHTDRGQHLYELEVDEADIEFVGDLDYYSAVVDALAIGMPADDYVKAYCSEIIASERVEMLVKKAVVKARLFHNDEKGIS